MSRNIGALYLNGESLDGGVNTLNVKQAFSLVPNEDKRTEDSPDFLVQARNRFGDTVEIGAAWSKVKNDHNGTRRYLSISLNDPDLPEWCERLAAFEDEQNQGEYRIVA